MEQDDRNVTVLKRALLVGHEGKKRRDDNRGTFAQHCRNLVNQRLPETGRQRHEHVESLEEGDHCRLLLGSQPFNAKGPARHPPAGADQVHATAVRSQYRLGSSEGPRPATPRRTIDNVNVILRPRALHCCRSPAHGICLRFQDHGSGRCSPVHHRRDECKAARHVLSDLPPFHAYRRIASGEETSGRTAASVLTEPALNPISAFGRAMA